MRAKSRVLLILFTIMGILIFTTCQDEARRPVIENMDSMNLKQDQTEIDSQDQEQLIQNNMDRKEAKAYFANQKFFAEQYEKWLDKNKDFVGWISVPELAISEPVVRGEDNQEYLRKDFEGSYSQAGTVFMDYRNIGDNFDEHMILYGHNLKDDKMFGPLRAYLEEDFSDELPDIVYDSLFGREQYKVFSAYRVSADGYEYKLINEESYIQALIDLSEIQSIGLPGSEMKILTLSTCSYEENNERLVVHAYRIEEADE